jgi:hypothetical protein
MRGARGRPARVARRWLVFMLGLHALANAARALLAWQQDTDLAGLVTLSMPRGFLTAFGALWALSFAACAALVHAQRKHATRVTICVAVAYQAALWINLLAFTRSDDVWARLGFLLAWSAVTLALMLLPALLLRPSKNHVESEDR